MDNGISSTPTHARCCSAMSPVCENRSPRQHSGGSWQAQASEGLVGSRGGGGGGGVETDQLSLSLRSSVDPCCQDSVWHQPDLCDTTPHPH